LDQACKIKVTNGPSVMQITLYSQCNPVMIVKFMKSILLVEDDEITGYIMQVLLREKLPYYTVAHAPCVKTAFDMLYKASTFPEIIFLDISMPELDGWDFLEYFETHFLVKNPQTKIYIFTSAITGFYSNKLKKFPFVKAAYMKPISIQKLQTILHNEDK
jgi:CheY-like chemotaxis protein